MLSNFSGILAYCLLALMPLAQGQTVSSTTAAPTSPLPLPANPAVDCSRKVFYEATSKDLSCGKAVLNYGSGLEPGCCTVLADYFGPNSTRPSRNCLCVPEVSERLFLANPPTGYAAELFYFSGVLSSCTLYEVSIPYWYNGLGECAGLPATTIPSALVASTTKPARSFGSWVHFLRHDGVLGLAFAVGLLSALGFLLMAWPVVFDAIMTVVELGEKLRSPRQQKGGVPRPYTEGVGVPNDSPSQPVDTSHKLQS